MRAGPKDRRINLEVKTSGRDAVGGATDTWSPVRQLWAQRQEGSVVAERFANQQTYATVTTVFKTGYFPAYRDISPDTHRIVFDGRIYNIMGALELGRKDGVELLCVARGEK